jgi:hypothetical protein
VVEGGLLCHRFRRLFNLVENQFVSVADVSGLSLGKGEDTWSWRRRLLDWEE